MDKQKIKLSSKKTKAISDLKLKAYPKKERTHIVEKEITPIVKKEKKQIVKQKREKLVNPVINEVNEVINPLEFNGKIYKTEIAKNAAITRQRNTRIKYQEERMKKLDNLIEVKYKKDKDLSKEKQDENKLKRRELRAEYNKLVEENVKDIADKRNVIIQKAKIIRNKKAFENMNLHENVMYKEPKIKKEIRTENRIKKETDINNNYGIVNKEHKEDRYALGKNFKQIFLLNNLPDEVYTNEEDYKWKLTDVDNVFKNSISHKIEKEYLNNLDNNRRIDENNFRIFGKYKKSKNDKVIDDKRHPTKLVLCHLRITYKTKKWNDDDKKWIINFHNFNSGIGKLKAKNNIASFIDNTFIELDNHIDEARKGSNFIFVGIVEAVINIAYENRIEAGSFIETPEDIANKMAVVNFKNMDDDKCLEYCIIGSRYYIKMNKKNTINTYKKYMGELKVPQNQTYPIDVFSDVPKYEELNNIKINIWRLEDGRILEEYMSENKVLEVINLLLIMGQENKNHFVWIKDLSRLFASKTTDEKKFMCQQCITFKTKTQEKLDEHLKHCIKNEKCNVVLPKPEHNILKFTNKNREFQHPFHVFADFESTLENVYDDTEGDTKKYQKHVQNSFGLKYNCIHKEHDEEVKICNDKNPLEVNRKFIEELEKLALKSYKLTQLNKKEIKYKLNEKDIHKDTKLCKNCNNKFTDKNYKVAHHDHINGNFISTLCNNCNLDFQYKKFLPVYIHNLKGYDAHLFITSLNEFGYIPDDDKSSNITCIPNNEEKYISFSKNIKVDEYVNKDGKTVNVMFEIRFIDSVGFMATSLSKLVENLKDGGKTISQWREIFKNVSNEFKNDEQFLLMIQKGIYPYDYINTYEKLMESKLPKQKKFNNKLTFSKCSNSDYKQAQLVWKTFNCYTMLDYHNIYLKSDVLLLADVWENFRDVCYKNYGLDCDYYYTAPSLAWDAMLKYTNVDLELITDYEIYNFIERGIRGGMSQISMRYAKANNDKLNDYDKTKELSHITYLDANNLYGWAMCEYLPQKNFKWNLENWNKEKILKLDSRGAKGFLFSVDLRIPTKLHDYFNGYVPCPEKQSVLKGNLNNWQQEGYKQSKIEKLITSFDDKIDYVVNYRILKLYLELGVELIKVNDCLEYTQAPFMEPYIMLNTKLRTGAKNEFEKDFFKLMNNSVFGKTMENVRNRINFRLISTEKEAGNVKNLKKFTIFNESLVGVHIQKLEIKLNKPMYLGQCILDDSKFLMYNFHYNFMLKKFERKNIDLLFTDTDSLCYVSRNQNINDIILENKNEFDLSNYPKDHYLYDGTNKKVIGKFKPETLTEIIEFVGLRSKLYSYICVGDEHEHLKAKGVKKCASDKQLSHNDYKNTLFNRENKNITQNCIRSYKHQLYSIQQTKIGISYCDDKVFVCDDNINTLSFGNYKIPIIQNFNELPFL